jgi:hypothetical protein
LSLPVSILSYNYINLSSLPRVLYLISPTCVTAHPSCSGRPNNIWEVVQIMNVLITQLLKPHVTLCHVIPNNLIVLIFFREIASLGILTRSFDAARFPSSQCCEGTAKIPSHSTKAMTWQGLEHFNADQRCILIMNWKGCGRKRSWPHLRYYPGSS